MISGSGEVVIDVQDQERAKVFWTATMGFDVAQDAPYGEERWLEVRSPDKNTSLVLNLRTEQAEKVAVAETLPTSMCCSDATTCRRRTRS